MLQTGLSLKQVFSVRINRLLTPQEAAACAMKELVPMKVHVKYHSQLYNLFKLNEENCKNLQHINLETMFFLIICLNCRCQTCQRK